MREVKPTQKPVPSSDIKDLFFNSGLLDIWATSLERKYIDRFGNCHLTAAGMEWLFKELVEKFKVDMNTAIVAAGYITIDSFQQGADLPNNELTQRNQILRDETTGEYYRWDGDLPKQVSAGSTPQSTGGIGKGAWVSVGDASLRSSLGVILKSYHAVDNFISDLSLKLGDNIKWNGYYKENDGGHGHGVVIDSNFEGEVDNGSVFKLNNGMYVLAELSNPVSVVSFGAQKTDMSTGIGMYCDVSFKNAIAYAFKENKSVHIPRGAFRIKENLVIKTDIIGDGINSSIILLDEQANITNIPNWGEYYTVNSITGIHFCKDREKYWNAVSAGQAYVQGINRFDVRLKYGQRVWKGNKTTTPNNILSNNPNEQQLGTGFWNKFYDQWMQANDAQADVSSISMALTNEECVLRFTTRSVVSDNKFSGFEKAVTLAASWQMDLNHNVFESCKVGVNTVNGGYIGGDTGARITTLDISKNDFIDTDIGLLAQEFGESKFKDNVLQPCVVGVKYYYGAGSVVEGNYFEVGHTFFHNHPNDNSMTTVSNNFANKSYSRFFAWLNDGRRFYFKSPKSGNNRLHIGAGVSYCEFDDGFEDYGNGLYFLRNCNSYRPGVVKEYFIKTTGTGSSFNIEHLSGNKVTMDIRASNDGIEFYLNTPDVDNRYKIIDFRAMNVGSVMAYYGVNMSNYKSTPIRFINKLDGTQVALSKSGEENIIRILYI
ncbi:tail fiber/spike domain-containing protein [Providencia rustigianii]|uniref:tail fiber/spike domain-containing protein n=1 Tax=Providencia rustigianii TaxID=158850 RepID=UPI00223FDA4C|nr:hypothetical protein [Providencia rustigianii]